ncbi:MAG: glycosyltransferase family 2 protein [Verrucomicrobiota bacterium]
MNSISIIIPAFREGNAIAACLENVSETFDSAEVIVADGSADPESRACAEAFGARYIVPKRHSRAQAMNAGAIVATGDLLLFLHADSRLPAAARQLRELDPDRFGWGGFYKWFTPNSFWLTLHAWTVNLWKIEIRREYLGDNAIFVRRDLFEALGGYSAEMSLFEDLDLSRRLQLRGREIGLKAKVIRKPSLTSSRRFQKRGVLYTLYFMQRCRYWYAKGVDTTEILRRYEGLDEEAQVNEDTRVSVNQAA